MRNINPLCMGFVPAIGWCRFQIYLPHHMMTSSNGNISHITDPFVTGIHRWISPHKGRWRRAVILCLIWAWTNGWANNRDVGDLRRHHAYYDVMVMFFTAINPAKSVHVNCFEPLLFRYVWSRSYVCRRIVEPKHYDDVIMSTMASQITGFSIVWSTICSGAGQRKHQSSASLVFVSGIRRTKGQ